MTTSDATTAEAALSADLGRLAALERRIRAAQAEQLRLIERAHEYAHAVDGIYDGSPQVDREFATRSFIAELATLLRIPEATASGLLADAGIARRHPDTLAALATGTISLAHVRVLLDTLVGLTPDVATELEAVALERAGRETSSAFRRRIRRLRDRMHPEALTDRHEDARSERRICLEPAEDGMAWLSLYLEAERGVAIMAHVDAVVDARADSSATRAQSRLDVAADLLLGRTIGDDDARPLGLVTPRVYVTVPVLTLLGHSDESAELDGYGPIDAETARRLAAHAPSFRRILTHPETGAYLSYSRTTYRVPADLAGYLRVRDGVCRFPGCSRRAVGCDVDHTRAWAAGGATRHDNLAHLCRKHHLLKHNTGWRMSQMPSGDIRWASPAGREYVTSPDQPFRAVAPPDGSRSDSARADRNDPDPEPPWAAKRPAA